MSISDSPKAQEEPLIVSPFEQLTSLQERVTSLENQIHEIELDLPPNVSKSILYMKKEIQTLFEKSDSQSDFEVPYVYSEVQEKIGDFQRRTEWKLRDTIQNKANDIDLQLEENSELTQEDEKIENSKLHHKISESFASLKSDVIKYYEEDKKNLNDLEEQLDQIKFQSKTVSNSPINMITNIESEVESHQKQIKEIERSLNRLPSLISSSRRLSEKFSGFTQTKNTSQTLISKGNNENSEIKSFQNVPDITNSFSTLESEIQATINGFQFDLQNILKKIDDIDHISDENEKQIMKIADTQGKAAELLSDVENKSLSMLDKTDDFTSKLSENSDTAPLEEMEKDTRIQLRDFKREIAAFKSAISKREALIAQNIQSTT